jgi:hypothetical protein
VPIIYSTSGIPLDELSEIVADADLQGEFSVDERQFFFKSLDPPSWVHFIGALSWWQAALVGMASTALAGGLQAAGKEAWQKRRELTRSSSEILWRLAEAIITLQNLYPRSTIRVGFPLADEFHPGLFELAPPSSAEEIAQMLVWFATFSSQLENFVRDAEVNPCGSIMVRPTEDGAMNLTWQDGRTLEMRSANLLSDADDRRRGSS